MTTPSPMTTYTTSPDPRDAALDYVIRRLQASIDDGSRPDQWSMEDIVRLCSAALAAPTAEPPARDREADRARFNDPAFNQWLDEGISDAGHTVCDATHSIADAWAGWMNREVYSAPTAEPHIDGCCGVDCRHPHGSAPTAEPDDQEWDENAERLTREAGLGEGGINPNATSVDALFLDSPSVPTAEPLSPST